LNALQTFERGQSSEAVHILERQCYSTALTLLADSEMATNATIQAMIPELIRYRTAHAGDLKPSQMQEGLDALLSKYDDKPKGVGR
jgi:hypothetical protein